MPPEKQNTNQTPTGPATDTPNKDARSSNSAPYQTGAIPDDVRKEAKEFGVDERPMAPAAPFPQTEPDKPVSEEAARILKEVQLPTRNEDTRGAADKSVSEEPPAAQIETAPQPEQPEKEAPAKPASGENDIPSIRTLRHDLSDITERKKLSLVQATALEEAKRSSRTHQAETARIAEAQSQPKPKRGRRLLIVIVVLVVLGGFALAGALWVLRDNGGTVPLPDTTTALMFAESTEPVRVDTLQPFELKQRFGQLRTQVPLSLGAMLHIVPYEVTTGTAGEQGTRPLTAAAFLTSLAAGAPDSLLRALDDDFFFGFHRIEDNLPIFVLTVGSYERAFEGMLRWEDSIDTNLAPLIPAVERATVQPDGTPGVTQFEDRIIRNYDVRVLRDASGEIRLLYAFPNRSLLIIAESPYSFIEALARLQAERRL